MLQDSGQTVDESGALSDSSSAQRMLSAEAAVAGKGAVLRRENMGEPRNALGQTENAPQRNQPLHLVKETSR